MIEPISAAIFGGLASGLSIGLSNISMQIGAARNTRKMINSNEKIAQRSNLNQLKIAEMQIRNLQEIEDRKIKLAQIHRYLDGEAQKKRDELGFERQLTLQKLRIESDFLLQSLDYEHQKELEKFKGDRNFKDMEWRLQTEHEFRLERTKYLVEIQEKIADDNRKHSREMIEYRILHEKSWALRNPSIVYLNGDQTRLLFFVSPPTITDKEAQFHNFPQIENNVIKRVEHFLLPFYNDLIDIDSGAWLSKEFRGNSSLKPLATELTSRSFVVMDSYLSPLSVNGKCINLSIAYKMFGQNTSSYSHVINDLNFSALTEQSAAVFWDEFLKLWAFVHCFYMSLYSDIHFFQLGKKDKFHFLLTIKTILADNDYKTIFYAQDGSLNKHTVNLISKTIDDVVKIVKQLYLYNEKLFYALVRLAEDLFSIDGQLSTLAGKMLYLSLEYWCLFKYVELDELLENWNDAAIRNKLYESDRKYLVDFLALNNLIAPTMPINDKISKLLNNLPKATKIDLNNLEDEN